VIGRRQIAIPVALMALVVVILPLAAATDTGIEGEVRKVLGLDTGECIPTVDGSSPWRSGPSLPFDIDEPRTATLDGYVYLAGGIVGLEELPNGRLLLEPSDRFLRFDPRTGRYTELAHLPRPLSHLGIVGNGNDLYLVGGYGRTLDRHTSRAFYRYEPDRDRWTRMPDMPGPLAAMAVAMVGRRLIVAGGAENEVPVSHAYAYDFGTRRWSRLPDLPDRREHVGAAALEGDLYVLGGRSVRSFAVRSAASYDVAHRRWRRMPPLPVPTGGLAAVGDGRHILAIGGGDDGGETVTGAVQMWDPGRNQWRRLDDMRTARHGHGAAVADGKVWVFGGSLCAYFNATDQVEWLPLSKVG
jgi:hypothetical protein